LNGGQRLPDRRRQKKFEKQQRIKTIFKNIHVFEKSTLFLRQKEDGKKSDNRSSEPSDYAQ
jgi:hypothetical protein